MKIKTLALVVLACVGSEVSAQDEDLTLGVGDKAPALSIQEWVRGEPVTVFQEGHVYAIEFGATTCAPCRTVAPHLTELAKQYVGRATVLGVHIWENDPRTPEDLGYVDTTKDYVASLGKRIGFPVAVDDPRQTTADTWMKASGRGAIPTVFIVDGSGRIAWIGSPFADMDVVLEEVVAGTFDPQAYARKQEMWAQEEAAKRLTPGDPAPELTAAAWLRGDPVESFQPQLQDGLYREGKTHVVFVTRERTHLWSRKSIDVLTELAKKYVEDVSIVTVYSEPDGGEQSVREFVRELGERIGFAVAVDTPEQDTFRDWVTAAGNNYVATAVIDGSGHVVWVGGYPLEVELILQGAIAGNGIAVGKEEDEKFERFGDASRKVMELFDDPNVDYQAALNSMDRLIAKYPGEYNYLYRDKYLQLVHSPADDGEAKSATYLRWMLDAMPTYFLWEDVVGRALHAAGAEHQHEYDPLVLEVIDRAVETAESASTKAKLIRQKASFIAESVGKGGPAEAVAIVRHALRNPGIVRYAENQVLWLKGDLYGYRFQRFAGEDDREANAVLREALESGLETINWSSLVTHALGAQRHPDYGLLLKVVDRYVEEAARAPEEQKPYHSAAAMALKADVCAAKGEVNKALVAYKQAVEISKSTDNEQTIDQFKEKLTSFQQKVRND